MGDKMIELSEHIVNHEIKTIRPNPRMDPFPAPVVAATARTVVGIVAEVVDRTAE